MSDTKSWMQRVHGVETPDLWGEIELRSHETPSEPPTDRSPRTRAAVMLVASIVILGVVLFALRDLGSEPQVAPLGPGEIVRYQLDGPPQPISVGEGAAWVKIGANDTSRGLVRIDAATGEQQDVDTPGGDWTAVGGGQVWLLCNSDTCSTDASTVIRMDPRTGEILGSTALPGNSWQIVGTPDGVWVTYEGGVAFIDEHGTITKTFDVNANLIGTDGTSLWVSRGFGGIVSLDPQTGAVLKDVPFDDVCTMEVAAGTVWVASCNGSTNQLMGLDATTGRVLFTRSIEGYGQMRYANGALWLAQNPKDGESIRLLQFDARSGESLGRPIEIPHDNPAGGTYAMPSLYPPSPFFVVGEGSFWLTDFGAGQVIRMGIPDAGTTSGVTDTGTVSITPSPAPPVSTPSPSPSQKPLPYEGLSIGARTRTQGWVVMADGFGVHVAGAGTLQNLDPTTGESHEVARIGSWDYDFTSLGRYGEGSMWLASGQDLWLIGGSPSYAVSRHYDLQQLGYLLAVHQASSSAGGGTWLAVAGDVDGGAKIAELDPDSGSVIRQFDAGDSAGTIADAGGFIIAEARNGIVRIDPRTGDLTAIALPGTPLGLAATATRIWWTSEGGAVNCLLVDTLAECGTVDIPRASELSSDGNRLWVLSATGSSKTQVYIPDPSMPATVTLMNGETGEVVAGPVALPEYTPASFTSWDGRAWVGFHDSGTVVRVDRDKSGS